MYTPGAASLPRDRPSLGAAAPQLLPGYPVRCTLGGGAGVTDGSSSPKNWLCMTFLPAGQSTIFAVRFGRQPPDAKGVLRMTCCTDVSFTWECCYPDPCGCDTCCCQGSDCQASCNGSTCGGGGCCDCNSGGSGFAWKSASPCFCASCDSVAYFSADGVVWYYAYRVDTHNPSASSIADLTKYVFSYMAPLSQGVISTGRVSNDSNNLC